MDLQGLHEQLNNIQSQLQNAMSTQSFVQPAPMQPNNQPFGFVDTASNFSQNLGNQVSQSFVAMNETTNSVSAQIQQLSTSMQMGAFKANEFAALEKVITVPLTRALLPPVSIDAGFKANFDDAGMFRSFFGQFGMFYDPNEDRMGRSEFQEKAAERWNSAEMQTSVTGGLLGLAGGTAGGAAIGGAVGAVFGGPAGWLAGAAGGWLIEEAVGGLYGFSQGLNIENERISKYVREGSFRFAGGQFSGAESNTIANAIQSIGQSKSSYAMGFRPLQIEGMVAEFTEGGGFDSIRSVEEYTEKVKQLVDSSQKVSHLLHTSLREATATMAQMEQAGITSSPLETQNLLLRLAGRAGIAGMTTEEMVGSAFTGASMVQGTGVNLQTGFMGMSDMNTLVGQSINMGYLGEAINQVGGKDKAAQLLFSHGMNLGTSPLGVALNAAGGTGVQYDLLAAISRGAGNINSREDMLGLLGSQDQYIESMGIQGLLGQKASQAAYMMDFMNLNITSAEQMRGFLMQTKIASSLPDADLLMGSWAGMSDPWKVIEAELNKAGDEADVNPGAFTRFVNWSAYKLDSTINKLRPMPSKGIVDFNRVVTEEGKTYTATEEDKAVYSKYTDATESLKEQMKDADKAATYFISRHGAFHGGNKEKTALADKLGYEGGYVELLYAMRDMPDSERKNMLIGLGGADSKLMADILDDYDSGDIKKALSIFSVARTKLADTRMSSQIEKDLEELPNKNRFTYAGDKKALLDDILNEADDLFTVKSTTGATKEFMQLRSAWKRAKSAGMTEEELGSYGLGSLQQGGYGLVLDTSISDVAAEAEATKFANMMQYGSGRRGEVNSAAAVEGSAAMIAMLRIPEVSKFLDLLARLIQSMNEQERLKAANNWGIKQ